MFKVLIIFCSCAILSSCNSTPIEPKAGNYPSSVSSIIATNCLGGDCHSGSSTLNTGLDLSTWDAMIKGSTYFNEIIPFNAVKSHFFGHVNTNSVIAPVITPTMPLARDPLSTGDQVALFNWIIQGAKSDEGKIPYSDVTKKIFVPNQEEDMVSIIDGQTQRLVRILALEPRSSPAAVSVMPDGKAFLVAMQDGDGTIVKYDAGSYSKLAQLTTNILPSDIALNSDGTKGYIIDNSYGGRKICVINPSSMTLEKTLTTNLLSQPASIIISGAGNVAYICGTGSDNILRIDMRNDSVMSSIPLGADVPVPLTPGYNAKYQPRKIVLSPDEKTMYASCQGTSEIVVLDIQRDSITGRIPIQYGPWGEAVSPDGSELWTCAYLSNKLNIISTATNQVIATIDSVSLFPRAVTFTPEGAYAFVACELSSGGAHHHVTGGLPPSSYVIIDCKSRKIISTEDLPAYSIGITMGYKN